jgi:hypothetical protein
MTPQEQIAALYITAQKLSEDFENFKEEANAYINELLVSAGIEEQISRKQLDVETKRHEIQTLVDAILDRIQELQNEKAPE